MTGPVRTRFAPSPTGELHLGNARTAVLNWLYARHCGGAFVLRLEDTDVERNVAGGEVLILDALDWLGLDRDEGPDVGGPFGPYRQSERAERHRERALDLLRSGAAFRCFCTPEELERDRAEAIAAGAPPGMDRRCRVLDPDRAEARAGREPAAIRLRVDPGPVAYRDRLKGELTVDGADLGDMILLRADGRATYNFAVAVDDLDMEISHVIRGVGHLSNTPKQVLLYRAFDAEPPEFVHIPTVLAPGGGKLSKRAGARGVLRYRDEGYHPDAIVNYLSLLSWSAPDGREFLTRDDLIRAIDLDRIGSTDAELDPDKMRWLSGQHFRHEPPEALAARWADAPEVRELGLDTPSLVRAAEVFARRIQLLHDGVREVIAVFARPELDAEGPRKALSAPDAGAAIATARAAWADCEWSPEPIKATLRAAAEASGLGGKALFQPIRIALTGALHGPDLAEIAYALGRDRTLERLARALASIDGSRLDENESEEA